LFYFPLLGYLINFWTLLLVKCQIRQVRIITINEFRETLIKRNLSWWKCHRPSMRFLVTFSNISYHVCKILETLSVNV
jgi:hypothetical protein